jgi:ribosomal-protein-alanine N-acetyltransferase
MARYLVVRAGARVIAYAGLWLMVDEAHVTTFAVLPAYRRRGIGGLLLTELMALAADLGAAVCTLEVRLSNAAARKLYEEFGFRPVGVRPRYYSDNGEDALIMTTERLTTAEMQRLLGAKRERYATDVLPDDPGYVPEPDDPPEVLGG